MKKGLIYLFMLIMSMSVFTACSDDNDDPYKALTAEYKAEKLNLTFNNKTVTDKAVSLEALNETTGHLALKNMIAGEDSLVVNVTMENIGGDNFSFTGKNETADRSVSVTGDVKSGIMTLKSDFEITNTKVIGEWETFIGFTPTYDMITSLHLDIKNDKDSVMLPIWNEMTAGSDLGSKLGLVGAMLPSLLQKIELTQNGQLISYYYESLTAKEEGKAPIKEDQDVTYNVSNGVIYIKANLSAIMPTGRSTAPSVDIMAMINSGIPLKYIITENQNLRVYVDKNMMLPFMPLVTVLAPALADIEMPDMGIEKGSLSNFLLGIVPIITNAEKAEIGLEVQPVPSAN